MWWTVLKVGWSEGGTFLSLLPLNIISLGCHSSVMSSFCFVSQTSVTVLLEHFKDHSHKWMLFITVGCRFWSQQILQAVWQLRWWHGLTEEVKQTQLLVSCCQTVRSPPVRCTLTYTMLYHFSPTDTLTSRNPPSPRYDIMAQSGRWACWCLRWVSWIFNEAEAGNGGGRLTGLDAVGVGLRSDVFWPVEPKLSWFT